MQGGKPRRSSRPQLPALHSSTLLSLQAVRRGGLFMHKNRPDSLTNQRLPGINAAKIGIILESCKFFANYFWKVLYKHMIFPHAWPT